MSSAHIIYKIPTRVKHLELKKRIVKADFVDRAKPDSVVNTEMKELGWYVHFEGSYESLCVGPDKPVNLEPGTEVDILIVPRRVK